MTSIDKARSGKTRIRWERIDKNGPGLHEPQRDGDVGWDLECAETTAIEPGAAKDVPLNIKLWLPEGIWAEIRPRSSIVRRGLMIEAGIIDPGYRGPLFALVRNMQMANGRRPQDHVVLNQGERIAQVIFNRVCPVWQVEVGEVLADTQRGEGGFGSTNDTR